MRWFWILFYIAALAGGVDWFLKERPINHPPGVMVPEAPELLPGRDDPWSDGGGFEYRSLGRLRIRALLLSRNNTRLSGWDDISPTDLALAWGEMSDSRILDQLDISQYTAPISGSRFMFIGIPAGSKIMKWRQADRDALLTQATHIHTIPATPEIGTQLSSLRPGQILRLDGQLVIVQDAFGRRRLESSTILGDRHCEIMWVESLELSD